MRTKSKWIDKKEELQKLRLEEKLTYPEIAKIFGTTPIAIRKAMHWLNIPLLIKEKKIKEPKPKKVKRDWKTLVCTYCGKEFTERPGKNIDKYCSRECANNAKISSSIEKWKAGMHSGTSCFTAAGFVRDYMLKKANYKCEKRGWGEENPFTHKIPLQIHHIDGNSLNNTEENLQVLCPNCHSLTENFGGRNKNAPNGKSQYYRRA